MKQSFNYSTRIKFLTTVFIFIGLEIIGWTAVLIYLLLNR